MSSLRSKIQMLAITLVITAVLITVAPVILWAVRDGNQQLDRTLAERAAIFEQLVHNRSGHMLNTVRQAAADPRLHEALAGYDIQALHEVLEKRMTGAIADVAIVMNPDGEVIARSGSVTFDGIALPGLIHRVQEQGIARGTLQANDGRLYEMVTVPLNAPLPAGWLSLGYAIDDRFAQVIRELTGLHATLLMTGSGPLRVIASSLPDADRATLATTLAGASYEANDLISFQLDGHQYRGLQRFLMPESPDVQVVLQESVDRIMASYRGLQSHVMAIAALILLLSLIAATLVAHNIGGPVRQLLAAARRIRDGNYNEQVHVRSNDELGELAVAFNAMQEGIAEREERITYQAQFDELTGLPNRILALERLRDAIERADASKQPVSLLVVDLNSLSEIGSSLGHEIGDALLSQAAERLRASLDARHVLARLEGDQFLIIMEDFDAAQAKETAVELVRLMGAGLSVRAVNISLHVNIGICCFPEHGTQPDKLLLRASVAKNDAKASETDIHVYEDGREERHVRQLAILGDLRRAVRQNELKIFMQPKICLANNTVCGAEALVRWDHPEFGFLGPNEFIPIAEQSGNISLITHWALEAAIRECRIWQ
ncbi:MAG TPA: diguanylate cyclase, partial [Chromatiales bacterium]|nr:diguanylate cyclase [Chromatiales bacterium]